MIRDITLGQYYQTESLIHKLDPRVKVVGTLIYVISLFINSNLGAYGIAFLFLVYAIYMSRVPLKFIVRGMKPILFLLLITSLFNLLLTKGTTMVSVWKLTITYEGLKLAITMALRLTFLVIGASIMTLTTTPNQLTDGLEKLLKPLNKIHVPVHEIAMMMSIALRFIPILLEETDRIMKAQMARGADFETGSFIRKIKNMIPILIPLFISAFRRAMDLAMAMEARCYRGGDGRTKMKPLKYNGKDRVAYLFLFGYLIVIIIEGIFFKKFF